jgi:hypothetical protein
MYIYVGLETTYTSPQHIPGKQYIPDLPDKHNYHMYLATIYPWQPTYTCLLKPCYLNSLLATNTYLPTYFISGSPYIYVYLTTLIYLPTTCTSLATPHTRLPKISGYPTLWTVGDTRLPEEAQTVSAKYATFNSIFGQDRHIFG